MTEAVQGPTAGRRVALLRGINVGGSRLLRMADLQRLASDVGLRDVVTVGASGNVIYSSSRTPARDAEILEKALEASLGTAKVTIRTAREMTGLVRAAPFGRPDPRVPDKWRMVAFLAAPSRAPLPALAATAPIEYNGRRPREVFYTMRAPSSDAIAMAGRLDRALGTSITVRNWNVVRGLAARLTGRGPAAGHRPSRR